MDIYSTVNSFESLRDKASNIFKPYLQIVEFLRDEKQDQLPFICFALDEKDPVMLQSLPFHQASFIFNCTEQSLDFKPYQFDRVIFFFSIEMVSPELIKLLEVRGCKEYIYYADGTWKRIRSNEKRSLSKSISRFRKLRTFIQTLLSKKLDLKNKFEISANTYKILLDERLAKQATTQDGGSNLVLLENNTRLDRASCAPTKFVPLKSGQYFHEGKELYLCPIKKLSIENNSFKSIALSGYYSRLSRFFYQLAEVIQAPVNLKDDFDSAFSRILNTDFAYRMQNQFPRSANICLYGCNLGPGGAERQITYLARELALHKHKVQILIAEPLDEKASHYKNLLADLNVPVLSMVQPSAQFSPEFLFDTYWGNEVLDILCTMPDYMIRIVWNLFTHLIESKPQVLHCWLDYPNITGAIAGWLAGVPEIIVSMRSTNPTNFPHFLLPWYQEWYQYITKIPNLKFVANAQNIIDDYSAWLGVPQSSFSLIRNGIDLSVIKEHSSEEVQQFKQKFGIDSHCPVIAGVFRLDAEKRPHIFLQVVQEVKKFMPDLKVLIAGTGNLDLEVLQEIQKMDAVNWIHLLGRREDIPLILSVCDIVLLTSSQEGTPNVLIEAQALGKPVICSQAGGVAETIVDGHSGHISNLDDVDEMVRLCNHLLKDKALRAQYGLMGKQFVHNTFALDLMLQNTLTCYELGTY